MSYLARHPEAQDTLVGISEWWLLHQRVEVATAEVRMALELLVEQGQLTTRRAGDGRVYYRRSARLNAKRTPRL